MKKARIALLIIVVGFIGLIVIQNWEYFNDLQGLRIDLFVFDEYQTPEFSNWFFFMVCFLIGILSAYFRGLIERYKSNKMIKKLYAASAAQNEEISGLKHEVELLQRGFSEDGEEPGAGSDSAENV